MALKKHALLQANLTRVKNIILLIITIVLIPMMSTHAQKAKFSRKSATKHFRHNEFAEALENYLALDSAELEIEDIFSIGICYYNLPPETDKAIPYFEAYLKETDTLSVAYHFLGNLYHENYQFDEAIGVYEKFKVRLEIDFREKIIHRGLFVKLVGETNRNIEYCNYGKVMTLHPRQVVVENLGDSINTFNDEYAPVISYDEKELFFTSRRPETTGGEISPDGDYYEDIYYTRLLEGSLFENDLYEKVEKEGGFFSLITPHIFSGSAPMNSDINSFTHDASVLLSKDGKRLYIYRDSHIWVSEKQGGVFGLPTKLEDETNAGSFDPTVVFSYDENIKFVSSEREGGYGGLDIYYSEKQKDGTWSSLQNLGADINTEYDDDVNYYDKKNNTLYFSSKGHSGIGGFDVFKSIYKNDKWNSPMNMGYPVNTPFDDVFYIMTHRYNRAYYSSARKDGFGGLDIYRLTFADERSSLAEIKGLVLKGNELVPAKSKITLLEKETEINTIQSDSTTGDYLLLLGHGVKYTMLVETEGFVPYKCTFSVPEQVEYFQLYQEIHHVYLYDNDGNIIGQQISLNNAFFDIGAEVQNDTMKVLFNKDDDFYKAYIDKLIKDENYEMLTNVSFYISEDSLRSLIQNSSPKLEFDFPENTTFAFLNDSLNGASNNIDDYVSGTFTSLFYQDGNLVILNEVENKDSLLTDLEATTIEEFPKIMIHFDYNSSALSVNEDLMFFANYLLDKDTVKFEIIGHTDNRGEENFNMTLGYRRARAVKKFFVEKGISASRLTTSSKGETSPIAPNSKENGEDNPFGRKLNRRVEFVLLRE